MWPRARRAACGLGYVLLALCLSWGQPSSGASTLPPGSVVLSAEEYSALEAALMQAQTALEDSSKTIERQQAELKNSSSVIALQSQALEDSSSVIAEQARLLDLRLKLCVVLGSATAVEAILFVLALIF